MAKAREATCPGDSVKEEKCSKQACPLADSEWSDWSECIYDCEEASSIGLSTAYGEKQRRRFCSQTPCSSDGGSALETKACSHPCPRSCLNDCSGNGECLPDSAACTLNCKVSCKCTEDENGEPMFVGSDCSIPATELQSVKETNKILLEALDVARNQIVGDPDCDFYERMNNNLLSVIYDPSLLPEELVESTFSDIVTSVETPSYQSCLHEEGLAGSLQKVCVASALTVP